MSSAPEKPSTPSETTSTAEKPTKIVKRYSNRKLYDTDRSRYVTLEEIAHMIKEGEEVRIIDNKSGRDLTAVTLTQIIYEEEKQKSRMPLSMLRNLIQASGETLHEFWDRSVITPVTEVKETAQKGVEELRHGAITLRDAATRNISDFTDTARSVFTKTGSKDASRIVEILVRRFDDGFVDAGQRIERYLQDNPEEALTMIASLETHLREKLATFGELKNQAAEARKNLAAKAEADKED